MNWSPHMEVRYINTSYPYNTAGSFMEYVECLTYEHVNFIFSGASLVQDSVYPSTSAGFYKFGSYGPVTSPYFDHNYDCDVNNEVRLDEYRRPLENSSAVFGDQIATVSSEWEGAPTTTTRDSYIECPRRPSNSHDYQVIWQDSIDPDNMTYEELLELGEAVGTQSRGLSQELISLLPISKYKCGIFSRKRSRHERCVICQMEYKHGDRRITLPCKHIYHATCGSKWLSINKACPICYTEVLADISKCSSNRMVSSMCSST